MARKLRDCPADLPQHLILRGNNRQNIFTHPKDYRIYLSNILEEVKRTEINVHAWVLMTNHIHLLVTPRYADSISHAMQRTAAGYARYFNKEYQRSGTIWEGRFKNLPITNEKYLLQVQMYIELNPVRASMCTHPKDYAWSSYNISSGRSYSDLFSPSELYLELAKNDLERAKCYRILMRQYLMSGSE